MARINLQSTALLAPTREALKDDSIRYVVHEGGTRSSKTWSVLQALMLEALEEDVEIDAARRHLRTLKATAMEDWEEILKGNGLYSEKRHDKTDHIYDVGNGRVRFMAADQGQKLRGAKRDVLYINEANELSADSWRELKRRTRDTIVLDYNPSMAATHWLESVLKSDRVRRIKSTYQLNPYLTEAQVKDIESDVPVYREADGEEIVDWDLTYEGDGELIKGDPVEWAVYGLGKRAISPDLIYNKRTEKPWPGAAPECYGVDFGYSAPMALVRVTFQDVEGEDTNAHVDELVYERGLTTADLIGQMDEIGVSKSTPIYCDAAEPDRIEELERAGYDARKAKKSVTAGLDKVKEHRLAFTPSSVNLQAEASRYRRKAGSDKPVKANDHGMDALRYAIFTHTTTPDQSVSSYSL
ncbi:phage terminase large subunit [Salinibacter ruber]|uniref:phage terminase large subunit n=1 Tax=Salinibacter ruber TaxID=146919 RepID=UPI0021671760|nr:phage terminase large subunit [Salinibacter ruber]